jgi:hypothetical protein
MALQASSLESIVRKTIKAMSPLTDVEKSDVFTLLDSMNAADDVDCPASAREKAT